MIELIVKFIEKYLDTFRYKKDHDIVHNSIMGYDNFIKQTIFELYYNKYISVNKENAKFIFYRDKIDDFRYTNDLREEQNIMKSFINHTKMYSAHKVNLLKNLKMNDKAAYYELEKHTKWDKATNPILNEVRYPQLLRTYKFKEFFDIFLRKDSFHSSHNNYSKKMIEKMRLLPMIYQDISYEKSSFKRCVEYYQLEINLRIETNYRIAEALTNVSENKKIRDLKFRYSDLDLFLCLQTIIIFKLKNNSIEKCVEYYPNYSQNRFILGMDRYIEYYLDNPRNLIWFNHELSTLTKIKKNLINFVENNLYIEINLDEIDDYFKDFIGEGQHIVEEKQWEKIKFKFFQDLYKNWEKEKIIEYLNKIGLLNSYILLGYEKDTEYELDELVSNINNKGISFQISSIKKD